MRIAIVLPPGGIFCRDKPNSMETVIRTLSHHPADNQQVRIFCVEGARYHDTPAKVVTFPDGDRAALVRALQDYQPDLIEFHQHVLDAISLSRHFPKAVSVVYRHNALKTSRSLLGRWRYQRRYGRIDHFVFVSHSEKRIFERDFPALKARAHVIPNAIDSRPWLADPLDRDKLIVFSARAMPEKGLAEVCAALPVVLEARPDWKAVLLLNDWDSHKTWASPPVEALQAACGDKVEVMHSVPLTKVRDTLKRAAIALTPSLWEEPLGLTALEAHAAGAALISSGRGGLKEASGPHALYVDPVTPQALSEAILTLIDNPDRRQSMAVEAQSFVKRAHSPQRRAAELAQLRALLLKT